MVVLRALITLLASLGVAAALVAGTTIWRLLHDPVSVTTTLGNLLVPLVELAARAIVAVVRLL